MGEELRKEYLLRFVSDTQEKTLITFDDLDKLGVDARVQKKIYNEAKDNGYVTDLEMDGKMDTFPSLSKEFPNASIQKEGDSIYFTLPFSSKEEGRV